jgi:hypothetical protein
MRTISGVVYDISGRMPIEAVMVKKVGCEKITEKSGSRLLPRLVYV